MDKGVQPGLGAALGGFWGAWGAWGCCSTAGVAAAAAAVLAGADGMGGPPFMEVGTAATAAAPEATEPATQCTHTGQREKGEYKGREPMGGQVRKPFSHNAHKGNTTVTTTGHNTVTKSTLAAGRMTCRHLLTICRACCS